MALCGFMAAVAAVAFVPAAATGQTHSSASSSSVKPLYRLRTTFGAGRHTTVVERFTRTSDDTIEYQISVADPTEYSAPWTAAIPMTALGRQLYEYACHEGNYAMGNILAGARAEEKAAETATH